jgi:hypothetical protein
MAKLTFSAATISTQTITPPNAAIQVDRIRLSDAGKAALSGHSIPKTTPVLPRLTPAKR